MRYPIDYNGYTIYQELLITVTSPTSTISTPAMPYIPTETIISAAILAALIAGWRYVQQNPQQELIPASAKKTAQSALSNGKGLFEDELTGESSKKAKAVGKKSGSSKKKSKGGAGSTAPVKAISETEGEQETSSPRQSRSNRPNRRSLKLLLRKRSKRHPRPRWMSECYARVTRPLLPS